MLMYLDQDMQMKRFKMTQRWSEELLADFQAYQFCLSSLNAGKSPARRAEMYIAISMVFAATKILEFFMENVVGHPINIRTHPPSFLRDKILGYIVNKKLFSEMEYIDFCNVEWSIFWSSEYLLTCAFDEIR